MGRRRLRRLRSWLGALLIGSFTLTGCATLPEPGERKETHALAQPQGTSLGRLAAAQAPHPRLSGFRLLISGEEALGTLVTLADRAEKTLDLQYYLVHNDESTRTVIHRVMAAAGRGVRVRLLIDDINTAGEDDNLLELAAHPNVEVRLFNPFPAGRLSLPTRLFASITDIRRINHRMHSKMFVADNAMAVAGGRNLGDAYFVRSPTSNFLDLDVVVAGPVVRELSQAFDSFWNHDLAYPVERIAQPGGRRAAQRQSLMAAPAEPQPKRELTLAREISAGKLRLYWKPATVLADKPAKIVAEGNPDEDETIAPDVMALMRSARRELMLISPYYVPGVRGTALMAELRERGVRVRVLTNSLAATDAPVVHIGYARYRRALLRSGVELHELQPRLGVDRAQLGTFGSSRASLHVKALVIDRRQVVVGSMNMDPRSERINSEIAIVLRSPELAAQLSEVYQDVADHSSYRLELLSSDELRWHERTQSGWRVHDDEPEAPLRVKTMLWLLRPFAVEELL